jgi:uncharacterized protein
MRVLQDVAIPMRDGVELVADVYLPDGASRHPCLLQRVAYDRHNPGILNGALDVARAVRRGYAVVHQDCRGRFASAGDFEPFVGEADDGVDTIGWIRAQPWCTGAIGMFGRSYSGLLQWAVAARNPPGLNAIAPMMSGANPVTDWFGGTQAFEWGFAVLWSIRHLAPDLLARAQWPISAGDLLRAVDDTANLLLEPPGDERIETFGEILPFLAEWTDPVRRTDAFAALSSGFPPPARTSTPALIIAGWFDLFLQGCLRAFLDGGERHLVVGPWAHGGTNSGVFPERDFGVRASADAIGLSDLQLDWFDRWLRRATPPAAAATTRVHWFHMGANEWRTGPAWPPDSARHREWHLANVGSAATGRLQCEPAAEAETELRFDEDNPVATVGGNTFLPGMEVAANAGPRDQRRLIGSPQTAAFYSDPLDADLDVIGSVCCRITLRTAVPGQLVVVKLVEVDQNGVAMLVSDGAAGAGSLAAPSHVEVELNPTSHRFRAGNRIGLLIGSGSVPRYRRGIAGDRPNGRRGSWWLVHGDTAASVLRMQVCPP